MKDSVYKHIELTGTSTKSIEDAVDHAIQCAHQANQHRCWFQMIETRGNLGCGTTR